jgi:hypothetical protein
MKVDQTFFDFALARLLAPVDPCDLGFRHPPDCRDVFVNVDPERSRENTLIVVAKHAA